MKSTLLIVMLGSTLLFSCSKINHNTTVIRDCTGTYLRHEGKDYRVCNTDKTNSFPDGAEVDAKFKSTKDCEDKTVCEMYHENEGWIKVLKIK